MLQGHARVTCEFAVVWPLESLRLPSVLLPTLLVGLSIGRHFSESGEVDGPLKSADNPGSDTSAQNHGIIIDDEDLE